MGQAWAVIEAARKERHPVKNAAPISGIQPGSAEWASLTGNLGISNVPAMTPSVASQVTAIHACRQIISGAISGLPVNVYERLPRGERQQLFDDDLWWLLNEQFNPRWSAAAGWEYLSDSVLLRGDAFAHLERNANGRVTGLRPIHPQLMEVKVHPDDFRRLAYVEISDPEDMRPTGRTGYDQDDILHIPGFGFDGLRGLPPLRNHLAMAGSVALATQEYAARFFSNGARPDYLLQSENPIGPEALDRLRQQVTQAMQGPEGWRRPLLLTDGIKFTPITMPLEDVELLAIRQFQVEEIARAFGVPPFMIGHNEKTTSWGSGVEAMGIGFVRYTLRPWLNRIENELNRKIFRSGMRFVAFDTTELERADTKSLFESFRIALGRAGEAGFMTVDEVRSRLNMMAMGGKAATLQSSDTGDGDTVDA